MYDTRQVRRLNMFGRSAACKAILVVVMLLQMVRFGSTAPAVSALSRMDGLPSASNRDAAESVSSPSTGQLHRSNPLSPTGSLMMTSQVGLEEISALRRDADDVIARLESLRSQLGRFASRANVTSFNNIRHDVIEGRGESQPENTGSTNVAGQGSEVRVRERRSEREEGSVPGRVGAAVRLYHSATRKFVDLGAGKSPRLVHTLGNCKDCELELIPACQLVPSVIMCPRNDVIAIRRRKTQSYLCRNSLRELHIRKHLPLRRPQRCLFISEVTKNGRTAFYSLDFPHHPSSASCRDKSSQHVIGNSSQLVAEVKQRSSSPETVVEPSPSLGPKTSTKTSSNQAKSPDSRQESKSSGTRLNPSGWSRRVQRSCRKAYIGASTNKSGLNGFQSSRASRNHIFIVERRWRWKQPVYFHPSGRVAQPGYYY